MKKEIDGAFCNDPEMSVGDLNKISILSEYAASEKWVEYISVFSRHFKEMKEEEWPSKIVTGRSAWYRWAEDWNKNNFFTFKARLLDLNIPTGCILYVFWMKEMAIKTEWGVFCNNWANFLYEDEGCILVMPEHKLSLVLANGLAWLGERGITEK